MVLVPQHVRSSLYRPATSSLGRWWTPRRHRSHTFMPWLSPCSWKCDERRSYRNALLSWKMCNKSLHSEFFLFLEQLCNGGYFCSVWLEKHKACSFLILLHVTRLYACAWSTRHLSGVYPIVPKEAIVRIIKDKRHMLSVCAPHDAQEKASSKTVCRYAQSLHKRTPGV